MSTYFTLCPIYRINKGEAGKMLLKVLELTTWCGKKIKQSYGRKFELSSVKGSKSLLEKYLSW